MSASVQEYVVGFALDGEHVALIEKNRPAWQAGRLNGIGGHVEPGEEPLVAMRREFVEETGVEVDDWDLFVVMDFPGARIHFYRARVPRRLLWSLRTTTDEQVKIQSLRGAPTPDWWLPNLMWLVPLAAYTADTYEPIHVKAATAEVLAPQEEGDQRVADAWDEGFAAGVGSESIFGGANPDEVRNPYSRALGDNE